MRFVVDAESGSVSASAASSRLSLASSSASTASAYAHERQRSLNESRKVGGCGVPSSSSPSSLAGSATRGSANRARFTDLRALVALSTVSAPRARFNPPLLTISPGRLDTPSAAVVEEVRVACDPEASEVSNRACPRVRANARRVAVGEGNEDLAVVTWAGVVA